MEQHLNLKITEVWKLTDDKTLSIDYTSESQRGTRNQTFVYDKKSSIAKKEQG